MRRLFLRTAPRFALPAHAVTIDQVTAGDLGSGPAGEGALEGLSERRRPHPVEWR